MANPLKLLGVFVVIVLVAIAGAAVVGSTGDTGQPDGTHVDGQSPGSFQPENVNQEFDPEEGEISIDTDEDPARILVDTSHGNQVSEEKLEPVAEAMFESGHDLQFGPDSSSQQSGVGGSSYEERLANYDGVLVVQPIEEFSQSERNALNNYTDAGGRVVILGEPTQVQAALGLFGVPSAVSFGAANLTRSYGFQVGAEMLYNSEQDQNDNNFKSIYASPTRGGELTQGVETVTFDRSGYVVRNEQHEGADDINVLLTAADETRTLDTRRQGEYPVAVRNDEVVFVADSTFLEPSEVYDVDNEVFVGNLMDFLVSGDVDEDFPSDGSTESPPEPPEPPQEPTPTPPNDTTPTPPGQ